MDGCRSGARSQAEAPHRRAVLRAGRLPGHRAPEGGAAGPDCEGAGGSGAHAARGRSAQARREGLRLRARAAFRPLPTDRLPSPEEAARRRPRRVGAARAVGLLLRRTRCDGGTERMAELATCGCGPDCCGGSVAVETQDMGEAVRDRYGTLAAAALESESELSLGCGNPI